MFSQFSTSFAFLFQEHEIYLQRANRQKKVLDIEFSFNETAAGPGAPDRGGRGGGRGRGGRDRRGGGRGGERGDRGDRGDRGERRGGGGFGKVKNHSFVSLYLNFVMT